MYLSNLKLWNFRKFGSISDFDIKKPDFNLNFKKGLNVLIGENDTGKSAIIDAIKLVLRTHSYEWLRVTDEDFFKEAERFRIEIQFNDLADEEAKNFTEWLGWTGEDEKAKPFLRLIYNVTRKNGKILPSDVQAGVDDEGYQLTAEAREYVKVTYLKPLRDTKSEFVPKKNSRLSQILQEHEAFKGNEESHYLVNLFNHFNLSIEKYFEAQKPKGDGSKHFEDIEDKKGKELKDKIDEFIHELYDRTKNSQFSVSEGKLKNILEKLELSIENEINPGLGTLNRLFMASELLHLGKPNWNGVRLGLIEELEAHLHPQAQMQIVETLQKEKNIQLILTTHSPNLASKLKLENLIICNNCNVFPMGSNYTKLDPVDYKFLEKFLDTTKSNLFFAKGVILVEGWAEEIIIPSIAKNIGINLTEKGVSIVNVGNLGFAHYANIFLRTIEPFMTIPIAIITDVDIREYKKDIRLDEEGEPVKNKQKKNIYDYTKNDRSTSHAVNKKIKEICQNEEQSVKYFVAPKWTLEYCLYLSLSLSSIFQNFVQTIHTGTDWDTNFEKSLAEKLINKGLKKTEIAYQLAHFLEEDSDKENPEIKVNKEDKAIKYLIEAIEYACGN